MISARQWDELARHIADRMGIVVGCKVAVAMTGIEAYPGVLALVEETYRRGGTPQVLLVSEEFDRAAVLYADPSVIAEPAALEVAAMQWADVYVAFREMTPPAGEAANVERLARQRLAKGAVSSLRWQQTRWVLVRVPTTEWAQLIGVDYDVLVNEFFAGTLGDWAMWRLPWDSLAARLGGTREVRIIADDTDLVLNVQGRRWVVFAGEENLPDGELATAPVENSTEGFITFPGTFWFAATRVSDLRLTFREGRVTHVAAREGGDFVRALVRGDSGSDRLGELGIGLNPGMHTITGDLFFDEKILGTVHVALGRAYPQCGGVNQSSVHWDLVKDLRPAAPSGPGSLMCDGSYLIERGVPSGWLSVAPEPITEMGKSE